MIRPDDRVAAVLDANARLLDVFIEASPAFERLRNPAMRRVMARLVTVEHAARVAGVDLESLLVRLNAAAGGSPDAAAGSIGEGVAEESADRPACLAALAPENVRDLDVREDLRRGQEPFTRIMAARQALEDGQVLRLRAIFEPVPLYAVMARHGFAYWTERLAPDDWRVWFYRDRTGGVANEAAPPPGSDGVAGDGDLVVLDVRGLEPPEPLVRTLAALESLSEGATLVQLNQRVPRFLLPRLEELGYHYEVREQSDQLVRLFIRRAEEPPNHRP